MVRTLRSGKEVPHDPTLAGRAAHYSHPDRIAVSTQAVARRERKNKDTAITRAKHQIESKLEERRQKAISTLSKVITTPDRRELVLK
jgi:hypothetical protein